MYKYKKEKKEDSQAKVGKQWRSKAGSLYPYLPDKAISPIHFNSSNAVVSALLWFPLRLLPSALAQSGEVSISGSNSFFLSFLVEFAKCCVYLLYLSM